MRFSQAEKHEIIRLVEGSDLGVNKTLKELGIHKRTFYNWYKRYEEKGYDGLACSGKKKNQVWNKIPEEERNKIVEIALDKPELSSRELAFHITDTEKRYVSESSVYRILKERGLITAPAFNVICASDSFKDKTTRINELWQTDFTYFKIVGWGTYYLSTIIDDYSRFIISWKLCPTMAAVDVKETLNDALEAVGISKKDCPKLLTDNGPCYISHELKAYLKEVGIKHIHGRPCHPQTQGKIERYHRTMKNVIKLDNYYSTEELVEKIKEFVHYYNYQRYHESLSNVTPADVYYGKAMKILAEREKIKQETIKKRRKQYLKTKLEAAIN